MLFLPRLLVSPCCVRCPRAAELRATGDQIAVHPLIRAADRRLALRMIAAGAVIGLAATLLVVFIPV